MYDKFGRVLRLETTTNNVSFFKHHRKVEHRDGHATRELAARQEDHLQPDRSARDPARLQSPLPGVPLGASRTPPTASVTSPAHRARATAIETIKGLNFFDRTEQRLLRALQRPEFNIHGVRRADLQPFLPAFSASRLSRQLHRLRSLGLIKRVARSYRYYLTRLGRSAIAAACSLTQFQIIPALASPT